MEGDSRGRQGKAGAWQAMVGEGKRRREMAGDGGGWQRCNMCTCFGNSTQERVVQDLLCLSDLDLVL